MRPKPSASLVVTALAAAGALGPPGTGVRFGAGVGRPVGEGLGLGRGCAAGHDERDREAEQPEPARGRHAGIVPAVTRPGQRETAVAPQHDGGLEAAYLLTRSAAGQHGSLRSTCRPIVPSPQARNG